MSASIWDDHSCRTPRDDEKILVEREDVISGASPALAAGDITSILGGYVWLSSWIRG